MSSVAVRAVVRTLLPEGGKLPAAVWAARHRWTVRLLWLHVPGIVIMALVRQNSLVHAMADASPVAVAAMVAGTRLLPSRWRAAAATAGLVTASAVLVHLSGGLVEMHFHFFVMIAFVTMYHDWVPFLVALGFVLAHHTVFGTIQATSVFNHPAALAQPVKWAGVHGLFVLGASVAAITNWRMNEAALDARRRSKDQLDEAQRLSHLGSWQWDVVADTVTWSKELFRIFGLEPDELQATYAGYLAWVHSEDREQFQQAVGEVMAGTRTEYDHRIVRPDGETRWLHCWGTVITDGDGKPVRLTGSAQDVTDRKRAEEALAHQALHDSLTGLANRVLFGDRLEHALARQARDGGMSAVLFLDLDDFKTVNDGLGHSQGDELLVAVADRLAGNLRDPDTAARLGGDEFAILLEGLHDDTEPRAVAGRLLDSLREPLTIQGTLLAVGASIGIAMAGSGSDPGQLLRQADVAMYRAKAEGKNRFCVFETQMDEEMMQRLELRAELQGAIEKGEFVNHYQPLVDLDTGVIVGVEALVRWRHPERGLLAPGAFMAMAEESGLVVPIGRQVLREACRQAREWQARRPGLSVNVNLSPHQLQDRELVGEVASALAGIGLDGSCLTLEITESVLLTDDPSRALAALKALGVEIALDDFGTGYSSLSHLERFPVDVLKMDKRFVDGLGGGEPSALTRAIVGLGGMLGVKVVAEGIERPEQLEALRTLGCRYGQGYLFAPPLPAADLSRLFDDHLMLAAANPGR